jgi:hypothetical protein
MIRRAGEDGRRPVELLRKQHAYKLVRPRQPAKRQAPVGAGEKIGRKSVRPADHENRARYRAGGIAGELSGAAGS